MKVSRRFRGISASCGVFVVGLATVAFFPLLATSQVESDDLKIVIAIVIGLVGGVPIGLVGCEVYRHFVPPRFH